MIATIHHMRLAGDFSRIDPRHEDCMRWQGQTPGKLQRLRRDIRETQLGCGDCPGLRGQTAGTPGGGEDCLRRDRRGEDCGPGREFDALAALPAAKIELECFAFAFMPKGCFGSRRALYAGLIELMGNRYGSTTDLGKSKGQQSAVSNLNFCFRAKTRERMCVCQRPPQSFNFPRF
jgi:hypothetical protein